MSPGRVPEPSESPTRAETTETDTVVFSGVRRPDRLRPRRLVWFLGIAVAAGLVAGVVWWAVVPLTTYTVGTDSHAATTTPGLTQVFAGDAWFSTFGLVIGVGLGILGWRWFGRAGWMVVPICAVAALGAALLCWWLGWLLGPGPLNPRIAAAQPGDVVPIELTVRARSVLVVWVLAAVGPILVASSLGSDPDDSRPRKPRRRG